MDKLEIKQGSLIQQTQYFIPVEIYFPGNSLVELLTEFPETNSQIDIIPRSRLLIIHTSASFLLHQLRSYKRNLLTESNY